MRDDFSQRTKDLLANRVGWKCSNPNCRKATRGAGIGKENIINIGVASHITAASKGGPRYDENITSQERASAENGIWLCQSCSKLIDSDVNRYTIAKLKKWKEISEQMAVLDLEEATAEEQHEDKELIKFFVQCFDRPAFQDRIYQEGRMEDFDKAIEDTIIALNTGVLRTRDGSILKKADGKSSVVNIEWREKLNTICDMLVALRKRLKIAKDTVEKQGYSYDVSVEIGNFSFPTKQYGDISLPAGFYDALEVKIGNAKGKNWWCVMFPPLCFVDVSSGIVPDNSKETLKNSCNYLYFML